MKRYITLALALVAITAVTSSAQSVPAGWKLRIDRSTSASDPDGTGNIKFTTEGAGFRAVNPQAAVYWNPANTATGTYTLKGTFTLNTPSNHNNFYGLVLGGKDLDGAAQSYTYFTVSQNGTVLIKTRNGDQTSDVARAANDAVKKPDAGGKSVNDLEVRVAADKVDFAVNGTVVHSAPKASVTTDGIYGMRVNHFLDVSVTGLSATK